MEGEALYGAYVLLAQGGPQVGEEISKVLQLGITCASLAIGEALGFWSGEYGAAWVLAALGAVGFWVLGEVARRLVLWGIGFWVMVGLAVAWYSESVRRGAIIDVELHGGKCERVFRIEEVRSRNEEVRSGEWVEIGSDFAGGEVKVIFKVPEGEVAPQVGDEWAIAGWLERRDISDRRARKIWVTGKGTHARCVKRAGRWNLARWLECVRRNISQRMGIGLEGNKLAADLNRAMLLGTRGTLPYAMRKVFAEVGTIHVFAISGLHVMVVAQIISVLFAMFPLHRRALLVVPALWLYVAMIGFTPSAIRAAAMASVYFSAALWHRKGNMLAAWEVTMIGFALVDPGGFWSVGSILSFVVMLGILLAVRCGKRGAGWMVPMAAWVAGVPIVAHVFSRLAMGALVANLLVVPLAAISVTLSVMGVLASFVSEWMAVHLNNFAAIFTEAMAGVSMMMAKLPGSSVEVEAWSFWAMVLWYATAIGMIWIFFRFLVAKRRGI